MGARRGQAAPHGPARGARLAVPLRDGGRGGHAPRRRGDEAVGRRGDRRRAGVGAGRRRRHRAPGRRHRPGHGRAHGGVPRGVAPGRGHEGAQPPHRPVPGLGEPVPGRARPVPGPRGPRTTPGADGRGARDDPRRPKPPARRRSPPRHAQGDRGAGGDPRGGVPGAAPGPGGGPPRRRRATAPPWRSPSTTRSTAARWRCARMPAPSSTWGTLGPVAFEVDDIDRAAHQGWSVLVQGIGRDVTEGVDAWSQGLRTSGLEPWVEGDKGHWIAIASPTITDAASGPGVPRTRAPPSRAALSRRQARRPARRCAGAWPASWARPRPAGA